MDWVKAVLCIGGSCLFLAYAVHLWVVILEHYVNYRRDKQYSFKYACTFTAVIFLGTSILAVALIIIIKG